MSLKLYFAPGACSLSPHIVLREAGLDFELDKVDLRSKHTASGADYAVINPKGYVPALGLEDGQVLTEGTVIVQYLADLAPDKRLIPPAGTLERYRVQELLSYLAMEVHKSYSPLFDSSTTDDQRAHLRERILMRLAPLNERLAHQPFVMGDTFTVADAYLFTLLSWARWVNVDLAGLPHLVAYKDRVAERPAVHAALEAERAARG